jgi:hypothetical protein
VYEKENHEKDSKESTNSTRQNWKAESLIIMEMSDVIQSPLGERTGDDSGIIEFRGRNYVL